jgi:fluoride exporter
MQAVFLVGLGGGLGAVLRYGFGVLVGRFHGSGFPLATLIINILGSCAMGVLIGALSRFMPAWGEQARLFAAVGILGGFTTFSSFSLDAIALIERGEIALACAYMVLSVVVSLIALYLGLLVMRGAV